MILKNLLLRFWKITILLKKTDFLYDIIILYNNLDDLLALSVLCCLFLCDVVQYVKLLLDPKTLSLGALLSVQGDLEGLHGMAVVLAVKEKSNVSLV